MKIRFSRKLHLAFAAMLATTLALAWYFYDSVRWFEHDVERVATANDILGEFRLVESLGAERLRVIEESAAAGRMADPSRWQGLGRELAGAFGRAREALAEERVLAPTTDDAGQRGALEELEGLAEQIGRAGDAVLDALASAEPAVARDAWQALARSGTPELFRDLAENLTAQRREVVAEAQDEAVSLAHYITGVLPMFMLAFAAITGLVAWLFSRSLTHSVGVLHRGAKAFTGGELAHRIPELGEREFHRLGESFNAMAEELAEHRAKLHDTNVRLEAIVSERTRALQESNERLAAVDESRRKLLADISHEFRTPLTVIRGEAEIAMRGKKRPAAEYRETLERIMEQADQTTRLIDDLLFIARADAGEPRLKVRSVALNEVIEAVCADFAAEAQRQEIALETALDGEPLVVAGDDGRLRQVFAILVDNALRYSHPGGRIEVATRRGDDTIVVTVTDNGIGISEEEAAQVFQRFYRGGRAQAHARGTGLGLPVARAIVEAHEGSIRIEGRPDEGTVVTVTLPTGGTLKAVA